jgi:hypothetical protein
MRFLYVFLLVAAVGCGKKEEAPDLGGPGADLQSGSCTTQSDCADRGFCCGRITPECMTQASATCVRVCTLDLASGSACPQMQAIYCRSSGECAMAPEARNCCAPKAGAPAPASDDPTPGVCVPDSLVAKVGGCLPPP